MLQPDEGIEDASTIQQQKMCIYPNELIKQLYQKLKSYKMDWRV